MLTYLLLSNDTQAKGDNSFPVQCCYEEFTSRQLDLSRQMENMSPTRITSEAHMQRGAPIARCQLHQIQQADTPPLLASAAATATEWQPAPATRVTLLLPGKECERNKKGQRSNMSQPASLNHSTQTNSFHTAVMA